ncbi:MAG: bifunctional 4-hydroxy-2-oxoglutarate aldolase/2-dehydro-3-deoxy-phosphogluconate aldolase [Paraglaciecola sp.]|uniref:bifunctional 4-hydroxy-2-oxoglutarate aldolase/2-dehydro-3-deoxy-phosphogluconate aldolase n=1 Tax=Pseudomonadati TaxID=3379134 RepID=UPI00273F560A|nr:bifunctional 4-hydroxy-2-oxoglutarate aldolase/2-dehydro-3-deoxy-phosphogluconate aldolase [Paraglaciecola sp.]MDP5032760.1 bifunctional 4-hydroxy-2-oxoglutarate aldolase/2-dehydro-3-deoxy-phosphogluconate aldolase [Paraglaciecola sp.]MDP5040208.1 bifunctional 4-hydroxy-2-oxoglutarate aldolase/2-dehydro-3-deoxy-phosphogluconate aldolase [Paraglaciecola sp.]MDP5130564.1 bifunctional 4-hydroxy-2-oxoglutarate aldolase/2-dehydro-3-deoxy-phosphogluconate aldolase [Paraglaciecola sp.]
MTKNWKLSSEEIFSQGPVVPVLVIKDVEHAVPLAKALIAGGIRVLEVTLRTPAALEVIAKIAKEVPEALIGAGTVTNRAQLKEVQDAGAMFAISPGMTPDLLEAGNEGDIPLIPGISSISELMKGLDHGYTHFKFFPAEASGGVKALKAIGGPFPDVAFCPTGGISPSNYLDYLALPNVRCAGGSWLVPDGAMENGEWDKITELAKQAVAGAK